MSDYKKYINVGIECGQMGVAYFRVPQTEYNDYTHLEELRPVDSLKREALEMFINRCIGSYNVMYDVRVTADDDVSRVLFDMKEYGKKLGED